MVSGNETRGREEGRRRKEGEILLPLSRGLGIPEILTNRKKKKRRKPRRRGSRKEKKKKKNKNRPILPLGPIHRLPAKRREGEGGKRKEGGRKEREEEGGREGEGREREEQGGRPCTRRRPEPQSCVSGRPMHSLPAVDRK